MANEKNKELNDKALENVSGGFNPFSPEGICKVCEGYLGPDSHDVKDGGITYHLCDNCYKKYLAGEVSFTVKLEYF